MAQWIQCRPAKQISKQNITRDTEIKNKLTVTRQEVGGDNGGETGKGCQGTCINDPLTKPKWGRMEGGRWGWLGWRGVGGEMETTVLEQQ